jgi:hypothetical protein
MKRLLMTMLSLSSLLWALMPCRALAQVSPTVLVTVAQGAAPNGGPLYRYRIRNGTQRPIVAFMVGSDYFHGTSELNVYPLGWSLENGLPVASVTSPTGWTAGVIATEESPYVEVEWRNAGSADIAPDSELGGFGVLATATSPVHLTGHWTVVFDDGTAQSGALVSEGKPRIVLTLVRAVAAGTNRWTLTLKVQNSGAGGAHDLNIGQLLLRTLAGSGGATLVSPALPVAVGDLAAGASVEIPLVIDVPASVKKLSLTETGKLSTSGAPAASFSSAQVFYPKN